MCNCFLLINRVCSPCFKNFSSHGRLTIKYLIWIQNTHISTMPPKKKPRHDISGLKNQPRLTTYSSQINEPMSCASDNAVLPDPWIDNDAEGNPCLQRSAPWLPGPFYFQSITAAICSCCISA